MDSEYTAIRKHNKWKINEILPEFFNGRYLQDVIFIKKERKTLLDVSEKLLLKDTDTTFLTEALDCFNNLREKLDKRYNREFISYNFNLEIFTIYYLKIINPKRITDYIYSNEKALKFIC